MSTYLTRYKIISAVALNIKITHVKLPRISEKQQNTLSEFTIVLKEVFGLTGSSGQTKI